MEFVGIQEKQNKYIGFQYSGTGFFGYSFRNGKEEVFCMSSLVLMNPDIFMSGFGKKWIHKEFDGQITLYTGLRRNVLDESGKVQGFYELGEDLSEYYILTEGIRAKVMMDSCGWNIYSAGNEIARIYRIPEEEKIRMEEDGLELESRFEVEISKEAEKILYPYILAIPMLGF